MAELSLGQQDFAPLRKDNLLYVDKTGELEELIKNGRKYFLARPEGFGKTLTLSTLSSMFQGKAELFSNLLAEKWVRETSKRPYPVIRLDFRALNTQTFDKFAKSLQKMLFYVARNFKIEIDQDSLDDSLIDLLSKLYQEKGEIVHLIDNYEKPILESQSNLELLWPVHEVLKSFYEIIDAYNDHFRFLMIVGEEKYNKQGVF
ncbi:MAG: AAA family ATPase [Desulfovibrionaceae bacterium]|nr:AAA family ATPase [Desulfovibrionaceae bacterium]